MYRVSIGYCGSADCCLKLSAPDGETKEYLIESIAWHIISLRDAIPNELGQWIFENRKDDERT